MRQIGHYEIEQEIGRGGMAVVYEARQLGIDRRVALKELAGLHASSRFLNEARLAGSLNHPNIVTVYEYFEADGLPYIAMELLPRGSLRPLVGTLTTPQIVGVLDGVLAGLAHADEHGIVHRDLKPENVMRTDEGGVKISDFGIAKAHDELLAENLTPAGEFLGAPAYVSPEQALGATATAASDLYSVGVLAFELFSGAVPFADAASGSALLIRKVNERAPSLRAAAPATDKAFAELVDSLLEREPAHRPASPQSVRDALEEAADQVLGARRRRDELLPAGDAERPASPPAPVAAPRLPLAKALSQPLNLGVGAAVAVAGALLSPWLYPVAAAAYAALVAIAVVERRGR